MEIIHRSMSGKLPGRRAKELLTLDYVNVTPVTEKETKKAVVAASRRIANPQGFSTYVEICRESGLTSKEVLGVVKHLYQENSRKIVFNTDNDGKNIGFKILK